MGGKAREREQNVRDSEFWKVFSSASRNLREKLIHFGLEMNLVICIKDSQKSPNQ